MVFRRLGINFGESTAPIRPIRDVAIRIDMSPFVAYDTTHSDFFLT